MLSTMRLLTAGGTSLLAMHKYAPIWRLWRRTKFRLDPIYESTETIRRS